MIALAAVSIVLILALIGAQTCLLLALRFLRSRLVVWRVTKTASFDPAAGLAALMTTTGLGADSLLVQLELLAVEVKACLRLVRHLRSIGVNPFQQSKDFPVGLRVVDAREAIDRGEEP